MPATFRVGVTRDLLTPDRRLVLGDIGLDLLEAEPAVTYEAFPESRDQVTADQIADYDAVISGTVRWTAHSFGGGDRLTIIANFGVGYERIDVAGCTERDVILTITSEGLCRPMAEGALTLVLALAKQIYPKSQILREGRWADNLSMYGSVLRGKTLGTIGLGNIGSDLMRLLPPFELGRRLAYSPSCRPERAQTLGVTLVDLDTLLAESDFVCITCLLNEQTKGLIGARELGMMKPTAYLINVARGPIVVQKALTEALRCGRIRGAALDVFEIEPLPPDDPLLALDNVILIPHSVGWTHEALLGKVRGACQAVLDVFHGVVPKHVVNDNVLERPGLKKKLARFRKLRESS